MDAIDPGESDNHDDVVAVGVELLVEESFCRPDEFGEVVEGPIPPSWCSNSVRTSRLWCSNSVPETLLGFSSSGSDEPSHPDGTSFFGALVLRPIVFHWNVTSYGQVVPAGGCDDPRG